VLPALEQLELGLHAVSGLVVDDVHALFDYASVGAGATPHNAAASSACDVPVVRAR